MTLHAESFYLLDLLVGLDAVEPSQHGTLVVSGASSIQLSCKHFDFKWLRQLYNIP